MILLVDNYDSFTFNLYQYLGELGAEVKVVRNDAMSVEDALALGKIFCFAQPGGVDDVHREAVDMDALAQDVPGRSRHRRDDGRIDARQRVQQARLAGVGSAGDHYVQAVAQQPSLAGRAPDPFEACVDVRQSARNLGAAQKLDILVREVDRSLNIDPQPGQPLDEPADLA